MKRKIELLMGLCVILCAFVLARKGAVFVQSEQAKSAPVCIVVDAGHGGDDPGKIGTEGPQDFLAFKGLQAARRNRASAAGQSEGHRP